MWTLGELNPQLSNANAMLYRLTKSPQAILTEKIPREIRGIKTNN